MERLLPLDNARILELGCGGAWTTRQLAERHPSSRFIATEVDRVQHMQNLQLGLSNVEFRLEGAQAISEPDNSFDIGWIYCKSRWIEWPPNLKLQSNLSVS
ncbi:MAG: class I SAM-dependent methyltransferase, partial [Pseudomonadota bacterium]